MEAQKVSADNLQTIEDELAATMDSLKSELVAGKYNAERLKAMRSDLERVGELVEAVQGDEHIY